MTEKTVVHTATIIPNPVFIGMWEVMFSTDGVVIDKRGFYSEIRAEKAAEAWRNK